MEFRQSKAFQFMVWIWVPIALFFVVVFFLMTPPRLLNVIPAIGALCSVMNFLIYRRQYKEPIRIKDGRIRFYTGWLYGEVNYPLTYVTQVRYTKSSMIFYRGAEKRTLGLLYLRKRDEMAIYLYLLKNSVKIVYE